MKILFDHSVIKYGKPLTYCGIPAGFYDHLRYTAFDIFDIFNPTVFIGNTANITSSLIKVLKQNPHIRVGFFDFGKRSENFEKLVQETISPEFIFTNDNELSNRFKTVPIKPVADPFLYYKGKFVDQYKCHLAVVENIVNVQLPDLEGVRFMIFSNNVINHINYCGAIPEIERKDVYASAYISLCSPDNMLNCILAGGNPIPIDYDLSSIENYKNVLDLQAVIENHTLFNATKEILELLGSEKEIEIIDSKRKEFFS